MSHRGRLGRSVLAYHLARRGRLPWIVGVTVVVAEAWMSRTVAPGASSSGIFRPGAPLGAGIAVVVLALVRGGVAREIHTGRAALWAYAARSRGRWLWVDGVFRLGAALLVAAAMVVAAATAVGVVAGLPRGRAMLGTLDFLLVAALCMGVVVYALSAMSAELDGLLAALWIFPISLAGAGLVLVGSGWHGLLWPLFPFDALAVIAPGALAEGQALPGPAPLPRITGFLALWLSAGCLAAWVRLGGATDLVEQVRSRLRRRP